MSIVNIKNLSLKRGSKYYLKDINWEIQKGERWIVFGPNGCGKTTLLSAISGYRKFTEGNVFLFDEPLIDDNAVELRRKIGFISDSYFDQCFKCENALNIVLSGLYGQLSEREDVTDQEVIKAKKLLIEFGLKTKYDYPYDLLSKGQRQKVLLARALMAPIDLMILDEPCTGLDVYSREFYKNTLTNIASNTDSTMIYVTHHFDEIMPFFNKALLIKTVRFLRRAILGICFLRRCSLDFSKNRQWLIAGLT